tara:strand:- start:349 stop:639 length:291 start_codon:yes stop_codon:yes gene_type:complete
LTHTKKGGWDHHDPIPPFFVQKLTLQQPRFNIQGRESFFRSRGLVCSVERAEFFRLTSFGSFASTFNRIEEDNIMGGLKILLPSLPHVGHSVCTQR